MRIEALQLFAQIPGAGGGHLRDADPSDFGARVATGLTESLGDDRLLHGHWVQDLFRAVVISLDSIAMIKDEDTGELYCEPDRPLRLPDYRVVTKDGEHLLIEVKNVGPKATFKPQKIRTEIFAELQAYAQVTGARLVFAHYWSMLSKWTLVDASRFVRRGRHLEITVEEAVCGSEFALLGERLILTQPAACMRIVAVVPGEEPTVDPDFVDWPYFTPGAVEFLIDGEQVTDSQEYELIKAMMLYGGAILGPSDLVVDEEQRPIEMVLRMAEPGGHPTGSSLAQIYTNRYIRATKDVVGGSVLRMRGEPDPTLTRLLTAAADSNRPGSRLKVMIGIQRPAKLPSSPDERHSDAGGGTSDTGTQPDSGDGQGIRPQV
ncbi:hypothetical protein KDL01_10180 [Actinospica durhamensis]|uniref:Uncharacterized protein n=1 Tax=Actinospica durhamensis TaxID=1508375 RepID=A0A941EMI4_9ACTN|nr:hypothetical protein [Actinospica durhamensis]MBR7833633.1 hypothetical protein [Actinospica durhamensis]